MFELPENLGELSADELNTLLAAAREEAQAALAAEDVDLDRLEVLADAIDSLTAAEVALSDAEAVEAVREERAAALAARFATNDDAIEDVEEEVEEVVTEPVVASAKAVSKKPVVLPAKKVHAGSLVAASNLSGTSTGDKFEGLSEVVPHMLRAWDGMKNASNGTKKDVFSLIDEGIDPRLIANGKNDNEVVAYARNQARLGNGEGLLAAGGWCAPAEQLYSICDLAVYQGSLDLPRISVPRGSISYFRDLDYNTTAAAAAAGIGDFTNAELVADPPVVKPCVEVPCVTPVTFTLDVVSFCVRAGVLQHRAFPELVEAWLRQALIAYQHYLNARKIAAVVALAAVNTVVIPGSFGAIAPFLAALDLQAIDLRFDHGMGDNEVVEGFAPFWLPAVFRADASRRAFGGQDYNVTVAQINSWLASRNIRLQWVHDYIDAPFTGATPVTAWPGTVNVVLYPAGAYLDASDPILRVGALQDSTLLTTNREQLIFIETAEGIVPACGNGRVVTVTLCPNGSAGDIDGGACPIA